ncbi:MAG: YDG domain-containing protein, partial [Proteobacteria bacterium]|nr:YDG domain-containing protein [Pseudomonadota bacterium]
AKAITVTGITADNKVYDGNTSASIDVSSANFTNLLVGDTVTVSATGTFSDKNVGTNKTVTLTETYAGADRNNYTITNQGTATGNITQKGLSATISAIDKVYDGTNNATVSMNLTGYINDETLITSGVVAIFNDVNTGEKTVTVQSINLGDGDNGGLASNYSISTGQTDTATITPATLSITAANATKFVPQSDPSFTVIYNGFVGDDDASDLNTIGSVVRLGADSDAGTYEDVIQASGYADNNYIFDYTNGDFTIVPIDGLIINLGDYQINYGGDTSYSSASASYWDLDTNQIKSDLSPVINGNDFLVNYGEAQVTFEISPVSSSVDCALVNCYSSSNRLKVGGYNLGAAANSLNKVNITDVAISGSMNILRKIIDPDLLTISEVSKVYDGSTAIASVTASYVQDNSVVYIGDDLQIQATGSYSSRHVGTGKSININLLLSGNDANNYAFEIDALNGTTLNLNRGTITQRDSVTWAGAAAGGLWSSATSWVDGAIPDLDNVATIIIPVNTATIMDVDEFGTSSSTINNSGTVIINHTNNFNLSNIMSGTGSLQLSGEGTITLSGNNTHTGSTDMTDSHVVIAHANGLGDSALISNNGSLTINSGLTLDEITVTGPIKLLTDVNVLNDATFGGNVEVLAGTAADPIEINSTTGDITFNGTLTAGSGSKVATRSLQINGNYKEGDNYTNAGNVTFNDRVGYAFNGQIFTNLTGTNFYNFDITGNSININADIMTFNAQEYTGPVLIGDNGSNGLTRRLVSIDPSVTFNHSVNDSDGTHTLIVEAYALSASDPAPTITANGEIGDQTAFANPVQFITGVHDNSLNNPDNIWGTTSTDHVDQSINIRGVVSNLRGVNFNNFAANNVAAAAPVNNSSSAASNNGFTGGNQFGIVQQLLNQIRQNSQLIREATNSKPVVEVGVILENCEAISDDSECLAK